MDEKTATGIEYPTIVLDGKTCTVKFGNSAIYRLYKAGFDLVEVSQQLTGWGKSGRADLSLIIDLLHVAVGDQIRATPEQLADMIPSIGEAAKVVLEALGKMPRPNPTPQVEAAATKTPEAAAPPVQ